VSQENLNPVLKEKRLQGKKVTGEHIPPRVRKSMLILTPTELKDLLLLSINGAPLPVLLLTAKSKSSGHRKSLAVMKRKTESVSGTMATLEPSNFLNLKQYEQET
jgi:hypothetical protein